MEDKEGEGDYEDLRLNNKLPIIGQKLKIPGVDFYVEVTELKDSGSVVDGADQPVTTISFKGPNPSQTSLLARKYTTSLEEYEIQEDSDDEADENKDDNQEDFLTHEGDESLDCDVRRYFPGCGWFDGKVTEVRVGELSGEKLYTVYYSEDNDTEDLNQLSFDEGREYYNQVPQPTLPIELVRLRGAVTENPILTTHASQLASFPLMPSSNPAGRKYSSSSNDSSSSSSSDSPEAPSKKKDEPSEEMDLSPCAGCGDDVSPHYRCPSCNRSLHHFCGTRVNDACDSPPRHGDPIWCQNCKPAKSAPATEDETKIVIYSGQGSGDGIALTICLANNPGLGFSNDFKGISSFESMVNEAKKRNNGRAIETRNHGAWLSIPAQAAKDTVYLHPKMEFPTYISEVPKLSINLAEINISKTTKELSSQSLMRGNMYMCKEQHLNHIALVLVLGLIDEEAKSHRFFGASSQIVGVISAADGSLSPLIIVSKTAVRDKTPLSDFDILAILGITETELRDRVQAAEAQFSAFLVDPRLSNANCRRVDRHSGAFGDDFIPEASEDIQVVDQKKKRNSLVNDDTDIDVADSGKSLKRRRVRRSGSAAKSAERHSGITADVQSVAANWNADNEANFNEDSPLLPSLDAKPAAKVVASQDVSGREDHQQNRRQTSTTVMGMSPESVKVRVDSAANAARNEMHERFHIDSRQREDFSRQREREQNLQHLQSMKSQSENFDKTMALQSSFSKAQESSQGRQRIAEAYKAIPNPGNQLDMFKELVRSNCPEHGRFESPPRSRLSARHSTDDILPHRLQAQVHAEFEEASETSSRSQLMLQNGSQNDIIAKLDALIANKALLQGTRYAMSEEQFEKAKFDILTSRYS